jgi:hypothetical protein
MDNTKSDHMLNKSPNRDRILSHKSKRPESTQIDVYTKNQTPFNQSKNGKPGYSRKWKPYKYMSYDEKKRLMDKESYKDHLKQVI